MTDIKTFGFIGIGNMGRPMATNLTKGGYPGRGLLTRTSKRAAQFAKDAGAKSAATLAGLGALRRDHHHAAGRQGGTGLLLTPKAARRAGLPGGGLSST